MSLRSVSTTNWAASTSVVITKPAGLTAGDIMVAVIASSNSTALAAPGGWSTLENPITAPSGAARLATFYKTADSGDVAASNFTFTGGSALAGFMAAISSPSFSAPTKSTDPSSGFTPSANSVFIMAICHDSEAAGSAATASSYAITTSNPSWTEQIDNGISSRYSLAVATAERPEATATGAWSYSLSQGGQTADILIAVAPATSVTVSPDAVTSTGTIPSPTVTGGANVTVSPVTASGTVNAPEAGQADWSSQGKSSSPTWTPQTKS